MSKHKWTNQIIEGDCRELIKEIPANSINGWPICPSPYLRLSKWTNSNWIYSKEVCNGDFARPGG